MVSRGAGGNRTHSMLQVTCCAASHSPLRAIERPDGVEARALLAQPLRLAVQLHLVGPRMLLQMQSAMSSGTRPHCSLSAT